MAAAGVGLAALGLAIDPFLAGFDPLGLTFFVVLVALSEWFAADLTRRTKTSTTIVPVLAAALLFGVVGTIATVVAFAVTAAVKAGSPPYRAFFNLGNALVAAEVARWTVRTVAPEPIATAPIEAIAGAMALAGLTYYVANHLLLCLVRGLAENRDPRALWSNYYAWLWPYYPALAVVALIAARGYLLIGPTGSFAMLLTAAALHIGLRQHARGIAARLETLV